MAKIIGTRLIRKWALSATYAARLCPARQQTGGTVQTFARTRNRNAATTSALGKIRDCPLVFATFVRPSRTATAAGRLPKSGFPVLSLDDDLATSLVYLAPPLTVRLLRPDNRSSIVHISLRMRAQRLLVRLTERRFLHQTALAFITMTGSTSAGAQVYITPSTPAWAFFEETPTGSGTFINGPPGGPAGSTGSIQLTVAAPGGELFATGNFSGIAVNQLSGITYDTYVVSSALPETANLQFDFDPGVPLVPPFTGYQGRAVFTPALLGPSAVTVGAWQTWDPMAQKGWWGSGSPATRLLASKCSQVAPCTLSDILGNFPNSKLLAGGIFGFKVGNSNSAAVVSVDGFKMGTTGTGPVVQYRFALALPAATAVPATNSATLTALSLLAACAGGLALLRRRVRVQT